MSGAGERVRERREYLGYSQRELAELGGMTAAYLSRLERGDREPTLKSLILLAEPLKTTAIELATGKHGECPYCGRR